MLLHIFNGKIYNFNVVMVVVIGVTFRRGCAVDAWRSYPARTWVTYSGSGVRTNGTLVRTCWL